MLHNFFIIHPPLCKREGPAYSIYIDIKEEYSPFLRKLIPTISSSLQLGYHHEPWMCFSIQVKMRIE